MDNEKQEFFGMLLNFELGDLEGTPEYIPKVQSAIKQADEADDTFYRLYFRFLYAANLMLHDDSAKSIPISSEFSSIFEEHPEMAEDETNCEMYLFVMLYAIEAAEYLPQIPLSQREGLLEKYLELTKRFNKGLRDYYMQNCTFYADIDSQKAYDFYQKYLKTSGEPVTFCEACDLSYGVIVNLKTGNYKEAKKYEKKLKKLNQSDIDAHCESADRRTAFVYLNHALSNKDYKTAALYADNLIKTDINEKSTLKYAGEVIRFFAYTNMDDALKLLQKNIHFLHNLWDKREAFYFYRGAYTAMKILSETKDEIKLEIPKELPFYQEDGTYNTSSLADTFYQFAKDIATQFDNRNNADSYMKELTGTPLH